MKRKPKKASNEERKQNGEKEDENQVDEDKINQPRTQLKTTTNDHHK